MKFKIEIYTFLLGGIYWLAFDNREEQRAAMTLLDGVTGGNLHREEGVMPLYLIEKQEQQDALDTFLRELGRTHPTGGPPRDGAVP